MNLRIAKLALGTIAAALTLVACSSNEAPSKNHPEPASAVLFDPATHTAYPQPYAFPTGSTTRVEVHYYDATGADIDTALISAHYTSIAFAPSGFATVEEVASNRFQREITPTAPAGTTATFNVGYGHDSQADENSFGPYGASAVAQD